MGRIQADTGLVTGIPITQTVTQLMSIASQPRDALVTQDTNLQSQQTAITQLSALLLSVEYISKNLDQASLYAASTASSSDASALTATVTGNAPLGTYQFTPLRTVQSQQWLSSGVASSSAALGGGTLSFRSGNPVDRAVSLSDLNGGAGFSRGQIRITDGSGATATVDLSAAQTIDDVILAINHAGTISVTAAADGNHLVLTDTSGQTKSNLKVQEVGGGATAASLGLANINSSTGSAAGTSVLSLSDNTNLDALNDGAGVARSSVLPDIQYTLSDGTTGSIDLSPLASGATQAQRETTLGQVLDAITATINGTSGSPKVSLQIQGDRLVMTDLTTPNGKSAFQLTALNDSAALHDLGLDGAANGNTITGSAIIGGLKTVLLSDLNGGQGLGPLGNLQLTDRAGHGVTVNLSAAETLQEVVDAINAAAAGAATKVGIVAAVNQAGDGIQLTDTSGAKQGTLVAADTADGTTSATRLGINATSSSGLINGADLHLQTVAGNTSLADLNGGSGVAQGTLTITDSGGTSDTLDLRNTNIQTVGDVVDAINRLATHVHAQLNANGDGIMIEDTAHGAKTLSITEGNSTTAHDLHLLAAATTETLAGTPTQVVDGSTTTKVTLAATDSLSDVVTKINSSGAGVTASILSDGSSTPYRLALTSNQPGLAGRMVFDATQLGLSFQQTAAAQDALLQMGGSGVLVSSSTNTFQNVLPGANLQIQQATGRPVTVNVTTSTTDLVASVQTLVDNYNKFRQQLQTSTSYDATSNTASVLSSDPAATQLDTELSGLLSGRFFGSGSIQSLAQVGVTFNTDGTLAFNQDTLTSAFAVNPSGVQQFFSAKTTGFSDRLTTLIEQVAGQNNNSLLSSRIQGLKDTVTQNQQRITEMNAHLTAEENDLYSKFYAMETAIGKLKNLMNVINNIYYIQPVDSTQTTPTTAASTSLLASSASYGTAGGTSSTG